VKDRYIYFLGIASTLVYAVFITFLYATEPRTISQISSKARETIESAATKGQVVVGTYAVDEALFAQGLAAFRSDNFVLAREMFRRADPERRDARTEFYTAYSFYRQGWGRFSNDDELFRQGLEAAARVKELDPGFRSTDGDLMMRTAAELENELTEGMRVTSDDFNPLRIVRERK
jgi:hypothetical protein